MKTAVEINASLNEISEEASKNGFSFVAGIQYDTHHEIFGVGVVPTCMGLVTLQDIMLRGRLHETS